MKHETTFAIFPSGYMDGLEYIQQHFDPYTRGAVRRGEAEGVVEGVAEEVHHEVIPPAVSYCDQHGKPSAQRLMLPRSDACWKEATIPPSTKATSQTQRGGGISASDLSVVVEGEVEVGVEGGVERRVDREVKEQDLVDSMKALDMGTFRRGQYPFIDAQYCLIRYPPPSTLA